jgi:hypothetical protein
LPFLSAWIAGPGTSQSFDVWIAFEFPALTAISLRDYATSPAPGLYALRHSSSSAAAVKNGDSTDGAPVIGEPIDSSTAAQEVSVHPSVLATPSVAEADMACSGD